MPVFDMNTKVSWRFAEVEITSISLTGLLTLETIEDINLVNGGDKINPDMLSVTFEKHSEEDITLDKWELVHYDKTKI